MDLKSEVWILGSEIMGVWIWNQRSWMYVVWDQKLWVYRFGIRSYESVDLK